MYYQIVLNKDETEGGAPSFLVTAPDFPELTSDGANRDEALRNGGNGIEEAIAGRISDGETIPQPLKAPPANGDFIEVTALTYLKAALYMLAREQGVTNAELARRLGWHREQVDRLFRLDHNSQLGQIETAFKQLGQPLAFDMPFSSAA